MSIIMARWKCATAPATASRRWNVSRRRTVAEAQPQCRVDGRSWVRRKVCDQGHWGAAPARYHWTVTVFEETGPAAEGGTGELGQARSRQRAGRVAAHPLSQSLFCRRIETQCPAAEDGRVTLDAAPRLPWPGRVMIAKPSDP